MSLEQAVAIATEMESRLATFEKLHGSQWPVMVREMEPLIRKKMRELGTTNPLVVASRIGKEMSDDGRDPNFLMAVCCAIAIEDKTKGTKP